MTTLTLSQVTKTFGAMHALDDVGFAIAPGERVALIGHNGAGKSTLMKILLGLIPATSGVIEICGGASGSAQAREHVAYHSALTGLETLRMYLRLRGEAPDQAMGLLKRVGLADAARRRIGTYSKGMRQRMGLAQALIGNPRPLVLDAPTSGLDPVSRREVSTILDELAADGAAILLSSHALAEVEARTDRIVILSRGKLMADDTLASLPIRSDITAQHSPARPILLPRP